MQQRGQITRSPDDGSREIAEIIEKVSTLPPSPSFLPDWPEALRALPNEIIRSALFNARNRKIPRVYLKDVDIAVIGDGQITYRGEELRQDDELVWIHLLHLAKKKQLGQSIEFTPYSFVKELGWPMTGQSYLRLRTCLARMQATSISLKSNRLGIGISVSLIHEFIWADENSRTLGKWQVWISPKMQELFEDRCYTTMDWEKHKQLPRGIASRLHGYWSSHRDPFPIKVESLKRLCGLEMSNKHFKVKLVEALFILKSIGFLREWAFVSAGPDEKLVIERK